MKLNTQYLANIQSTRSRSVRSHLVSNLYSQGGLTLQPQNKTLDPKTNIEASVVGIPPEWYAAIKQSAIEAVNANPQNYERVVDTLKARGVPVERFEALGWWKDLKRRAGR